MRFFVQVRVIGYSKDNIKWARYKWKSRKRSRKKEVRKVFRLWRSKEVKISNTPESIKSRDIMQPVSKFASIVNSISEQKYLWVNSRIVVFDAFHKIEKVNFHWFNP
jgi:hypothetical protein